MTAPFITVTRPTGAVLRCAHCGGQVAEDAERTYCFGCGRGEWKTTLAARLQQWADVDARVLNAMAAARRRRGRPRKAVDA